MRLLAGVEGSVLWLRQLNDAVKENLLREAGARGIAAERLVFAPTVPSRQDNIARQQLADIFLDTLYYNAHSTACDALWAGLPVVTWRGPAFQGRVAASLLHACRMDELAVDSLEAYEALALRLAREPDFLAATRQKLAANREPLFDAPRFTRNLEHAFVTMQERTQTGLPPDSFSVEASC
jgi:protein O-GlcNAc transferase